MASRLSTYLKLGRVSNLPTVWTNAAAGASLAALTGATDTRSTGAVLGLGIALSFSYVGGMFLNDAHDRHYDRSARPDRPIPAGEISAAEVFFVGYLLLVAGVLGAVLSATLLSGAVLSTLGAALALSGAIIAYDVHHKENALAPVVMGLCRALVYVTAGYAASGAWSRELGLGALALWSYVVGLTYAAKQEAIGKGRKLWPFVFLFAPLLYVLPTTFTSLTALASSVGLAASIGYALWLLRGGETLRVPRAVALLIAAMCFFDAAMCARAGTPHAAWALAGFPLTLGLQRFVRGT